MISKLSFQKEGRFLRFWFMNREINLSKLSSKFGVSLQKSDITEDEKVDFQKDVRIRDD